MQKGSECEGLKLREIGKQAQSVRKFGRGVRTRPLPVPTGHLRNGRPQWNAKLRDNPWPRDKLSASSDAAAISGRGKIETASRFAGPY